GVQFTNNDPATVYPSVVLVRGPLGSMSEGTTVASAANVQEISGGIVTVIWSAPVVVSEAGTYYVGVRVPAGPGKQGIGHGPALGANDITSPNGSYVASGSDGALCAVGVDLVASLLTSAAGGQFKAGDLGPDEPPPAQSARTFLSWRSWASSTVVIDFGLARDASDVSLRIYA